MTRRSRISSADEARLFSLLSDIEDAIADGTPPNAAIIKAARDSDLPPEHTHILVYAFNNGSATASRAGATTYSEKCANYRLADLAAIFRDLYPADTASLREKAARSAVDVAYSQAPDEWMAAYQRDSRLSKYDTVAETTKKVASSPDRMYKRVASCRQDLSDTRFRMQAEVDRCFRELDTQLQKVANFFRKPSAPSFTQVKDYASAFFGAAGEKILNAARPRMPMSPEDRLGIAKEGATQLLCRADVRQAPYRDIAAAIQAADKTKKAKESQLAFEKEATAAEFKLNHLWFDAKPLPPSADRSVLQAVTGVKRNYAKTANVADLVGGFNNSIMAKLAPRDVDKLHEDAFLDTLSPEHEADLRAVRTRAALHAVLGSPYFRGEDPAKVTELYNNVVQAAPRIAESPALLEATLRRYIAQGQIDPFDAMQLLDLESKKKQGERPLVEPQIQGINKIKQPSPKIDVRLADVKVKHDPIRVSGRVRTDIEEA